MNTVPKIAIALLLVACEPSPDYGRCLQSHVEHHHTDAHEDFVCLPAMDMDGNLTIRCQLEYVAARDWDEVVCDQWEFPKGRMEKDDDKR